MLHRKVASATGKMPVTAVPGAIAPEAVITTFCAARVAVER
jgi:hypothetical protein